MDKAKVCILELSPVQVVLLLKDVQLYVRSVDKLRSTPFYEVIKDNNLLRDYMEYCTILAVLEEALEDVK